MGEVFAMMPGVYRIGDLVIARVAYRTSDGISKAKTRPLIVLSPPNSKGDFLAVAGSSKIQQWIAEPHVLIHPESLIQGNLHQPTIFPASKQVLVQASLIHAHIGRISTKVLDRLMRLCCSGLMTNYFQGCRRPELDKPFLPGTSQILYAGRVYGRAFCLNWTFSAGLTSFRQHGAPPIIEGFPHLLFRNDPVFPS